MSKPVCDVAVIGAGLAGLYAAMLLEQQGMTVRVVEAKDRVGGRIHSMRQLGPNAEAGGTYIGAGYSRVIGLAERFGIPLIDVTPILQFFREQALVIGDQIIRQSEWPTHPLNPFPEGDREIMPWNFHRVLTMRQNPLDSPADWLNPEHAALDIPMADWMRGLGLSEETIRFGYGINTTFGADASDVSALQMLFRGAFSKDQRRHAPTDSLGYTVENGVDRLPTAMADSLDASIELEAAVESIDAADDHVTLALTGGRKLTAARVLCAVPFSVLRDIPVSPALPDTQRAAVDSLGSQSITQVYIGVRGPFWEADQCPPSMFTDSLPGMVAAVRAHDDPDKVTHLTAWVIGPAADGLDRAGESEAIRRVIEAIERIRPAARGQLEPIARQSWGGDPQARGAWAYFRPGQVTAFAAGMGEPHGRLYFAGEHLARASRGMEAALETAELAVQRIVAAAA